MDLNKLQQSPGCIGIMANILGSASLRPMVESAVATCESLGYSTLVISTGSSRREEIQAWETLARSECVGVLAHSDYIDNETLARLISTRKNVVLANLYDVQIGTLAAEYLISRGHRQIAMLSGAANRFSTQHRHEGFLKQAEKPRWRNVSLQTYEAELSINGGRTFMQNLLKLELKPSAVFFHHEVMAIGALSVCQQQGVRVPQDISLLVHADSTDTVDSTMSFTSVSQSLITLGEYAATRIINQLNGVRQTENSSDQIANLLPIVIEGSSVRDITKSMLPGKNADELISERERECLQWAAQGKTSWEMSQILNVSESTIIYHLRNATKKLDAANRMHAVVKAVKADLIEI